MVKLRDPSVQVVLQELTRRIERSDYPPGTWLPTERDLAAEFGVPRAVVRAALAGLAEHEVIVRLPGRRPWVNELRSPASTPGRKWHRSTQWKAIAAVMPQHTKFASSLALLGGINHVLRQEEAPYRLVIFDNYGESATINIEEERAALRAAMDDDAAGVVLWSMDVRQTLPEIQRLRENGVPVIFVDRYVPGWDGDFVGVDNRQAARSAVNYLLDLGHQRIGFLRGDEAEFTTTTMERGQGYQEALQRHGLWTPELVCTLPFQNDRHIGAVDYFQGLKDPPTAVFANNDHIAYDFIGDLENHGLRVPKDCSVVGFDDIDRFSPRRARLTTIQQPFEQMGWAAAELLLRRLQQGAKTGAPWQHVLLPSPLIVRDTCSPRPVQAVTHAGEEKHGLSAAHRTTTESG